MLSYILKRLLLIIPTLFGIILVNFAIIQVAPGGPVEQTLSKLQGIEGGLTERLTSDTQDVMSTSSDISGSTDKITSKYRGSRGIDPEIIARIEELYGFNKPPSERFFLMLGKFLTFEFDDSFYKDKNVLQLIKEKLPVSISLGLWTTLLVYLISIPLGIKKAVSDGNRFDISTSFIIVIGYAIPSFLFAILLITVFAGGSYLQIFPLRGLVSDNFDELSLWQQIVDYFWHLALPITAMVIGGFASLTMLTKNSFLEQISQQYVISARAKGCTEKKVLYGHVFRNAMLIIIAGFPAAFIGILFTGSFLIEIIFSLDGLGLLGFEAIMSRDYPVIFGTLFIFTLLGLILSIIGDVLYVIIDPRIDFEKRS